MARSEKTVFLSYRRKDRGWAFVIFKHLTQRGFDVFLDVTGIASGDFERVIIENIESRAHFIVLLSPNVLAGSDHPEDWLRREFEAALSSGRNIIPITLPGFDFRDQQVKNQLKGNFALLESYNALQVPEGYVDEALDRLCKKFLNVQLEAVIHPASAIAQQVARQQQKAALEGGRPVQAARPVDRVQDIRSLIATLIVLAFIGALGGVVLSVFVGDYYGKYAAQVGTLLGLISGVWSWMKRQRPQASRAREPR